VVAALDQSSVVVVFFEVSDWFDADRSGGNSAAEANF
jgi:hypothetical protein